MAAGAASPPRRPSAAHPAATGSLLSSVRATLSGPTRARPKHQIVGLAREIGGEAPGDRRDSPAPGAAGKHVAILAKGKQRLDAVIAVGLPRPHMQSEVDLGVGDFLHQRAASSRVRPVSILAVIRAATAPVA